MLEQLTDIDETIDPFYTDSEGDPDYVPTPEKRKKKSLIKDFFLQHPTSASTSTSSIVSDVAPEVEAGSLLSNQAAISTTKKTALFDGTFFTIENIINDNIEAKCELCSPKKTIIKGKKSANSNFLKHLKSQHDRGIEKYKLYKEKIKHGKSDTLNSNTKKKQRTLFDLSRQNPISQNIFDEKLIHFFVDTMTPLSIVEKESFKELFSSMNVSLMSRRNLGRKIEDEYKKVMCSIKSKIKEVNYVCTTADIWSGKKRSFFGVTCHWLNNDLQRVSVTLACRRFTGTHSYDKIRDMLEDIHSQFDLTNEKITATITDNGSNFVKAFKEFGIKLSSFNEELEHDYNSSDSESEFLNFETINKDIAALELTLPKHYRCASHTLNLLATTDVNKAIESNAGLKTKHAKALQKCTLLWKKASYPKSAEIIQNILHHTLSYPCVTRWNSFFNSVSQILKEKDKLSVLFQKLNLKDSFKETELLYLEEYAKILQPIAETLDFLQSEKNTAYGFLLPSIISLKVKLEKIIENDEHSRTINIIGKFVLNSLVARFSFLFSINEESKDAIIAAAVTPTIKLRWLNVFKEKNPEIDSKTIVGLIVQETKHMFRNYYENYSAKNESMQMQFSDFFDFKENTNEDTTTNATQLNESDHCKNKIELELLKYLEDKRYSLDILKEFQIIKQIYLKYNTALPSSASVERLFSFASIINSPRRHALSDEIFEQLVVLKGNKNIN